MRRGKFLLILFFAMVLAVSGAPASMGQAAASSSQSSTGNQTESVISKLVTLPKGNYNTAEAKKMISRISRLPIQYLEGLVDKNVEIRLISHPLTDEPEYAYLKGVTPRGWEGTGKTWDDVPGLGGISPTLLRIGYSDFNHGHGSLNLELHETGHTVDYYIFNGISGSNEFKTIWKKEVVNLIKDHPDASNMSYFSSYSEEYFAESFDYYYLSYDRRSELEKKAPQTYRFFQKLESASVENSEVDTTPPAQPLVKQADDNDSIIFGYAEAGSKVFVKAGTAIVNSGGTTAGSDGTFKVIIKHQKAGSYIAVTAQDAAGNVSNADGQWVIDKTPPQTITVNKITAKTAYVTGKTEAQARVEVKLGSKLLGTAAADSKGNYKVRIKSQKAGNKLTVIAKDKAANAKSVFILVKRN